MTALAATAVFSRPLFHAESELILQTRFGTELTAEIGKIYTKPKSLIVIHRTGIEFQNRLFALEYSKLNEDHGWMFCCYDELWHMNFGFAERIIQEKEPDEILFQCFQKLLLAEGFL